MECSIYGMFPFRGIGGRRKAASFLMWVAELKENENSNLEEKLACHPE